MTVGDFGDKIEKQWAMDHSKLVPILWCETSSLRGRMTSSEDRITRLERENAELRAEVSALKAA